MSETTTQVLPLLPLTSGVVLPGMVVTVTVETAEAEAAAKAAQAADDRLVLVPKLDGRYARVGVIAQIEQAGELPNGVRGMIVRGVQRATIGLGVPGQGSAVWVEVEPIVEPPPSPRAIELAREYRATTENILEARGAGRIADLLRGMTEPSQIADTAAYSPDLSFERKVEVLETIDVERRLEKVLAWAKDTLAEVQLKAQIRDEVNSGMEKSQREFLLRQQLAAIRKELGEEEDLGDSYRAKFAEMELPQSVREAVEREIGRLERTNEQSPEHSWIRTWLDTMAELPWGKRSEDSLDVEAARRVLDEDHNGLEDVKDRIVEYLAVRKLRAERGFTNDDGARGRRQGGAIIALVGPPGVGKTSLGESVARALGRKFVRVALGGVHDEAEIRGHRRTYVGARPGRIARALQEAGTMNPVFMLDEVDKVGADWRGDPSSALLEVLDPAQNHSFRDHYLEVDLDLSDVLFIATANVVETIPPALLDRMEVIRIDGYTEEEKVAIGRDHLLGRQLEHNGLRQGEVELTDAALRRVVSDYTREAGVRGLERELGKLLRKAATRVAAGTLSTPITIDADDVREYLGRQRYFFEAADRTATPGVATGLAVTGVGGDVLFVEASTMEGEPGLTLTGQLGDVMKESASIALSYVRAHADELGLDPEVLAKRRFHVHVPAGAVPKDGPSAGTAMITALVSLLSGRPVRAEVGMTGEVTLQGKVLPVGGIKQKVLAAHRAGLREVILPVRNEGDLEDIPETIRPEMTFHLATNVREVLDWALAPAPAPAETVATG